MLEIMTVTKRITMTIRNLRVSAQLIIGFTIMLAFVFMLGIVSFFQSEKIHTQTELMYNHPLQVLPAIGRLQVDILQMRLGNRDLLLATTKQEQQDAILNMEIAESDVIDQFKVLRSAYLGSQSDIDSAYVCFMRWKIAREENTRLALMGDVKQVKANVRPDGNVGNLREKMMKEIDDIDQYARKKAISLNDESVKLKSDLNNVLFVLIACIVLLSILIVYALLIVFVCR